MISNPVLRTPAAVLWDMDGTLIDSEPLWLDAELTMLRRYDIELTDAVRDSLIGSGLRAAAATFQGLGVPLTIEQIIAEWTASVIAGLRAVGPQWRPGAIELLASLREAGIPFGLVTMAVREIADVVLELLPNGLQFAAVLGGDEVTHEKPHPEPYLRGAELLGVTITDCVALEDSFTGVRSARDSGAVTFGIPNLLNIDAAPAHEHWPTLAGVDADTLSERFRRYARADTSTREDTHA
ncbi:HAD family phosphatase [Leucobacter sp. 7(1)]|uniref:HAD family hydrolase n=1 Tax=Leucobacter sp. 7(1) TaxID=1255613 RepID=UPI0020CBE910|nr:HAD family phosphatase [Leucobacter sp. 7(1)]